MGLELVTQPGPEGASEETLSEMLAGFARMMMASGRDKASAGKAVRDLRNFAAWAQQYPWEWSASTVDSWSADMRERGLAKSTIRTRQGTVRRFCDYLTNPAYEWVDLCRARFGSAPVQVCHEWNTTRHLEEYDADPSRRAATRAEIRALLEVADGRSMELSRRHARGAVVSWRNAAMLKLQYGTGLRPGELVRLQTCDLMPHPVAPEFGNYAVLQVRYGKRSRGGPFKRRAVQMVMPWVVQAIKQYDDEIRELLPEGPWLFPSERRDRRGRQQHVTTETYDAYFRLIRDEAGLDSALSPHCLRHSYQTHMAEMGRDPVWRQHQAGHRFLSTTSIYTHIGADMMNREMKAAIDSFMPRNNQGATS